jgi:hypothetical protein
MISFQNKVRRETKACIEVSLGKSSGTFNSDCLHVVNRMGYDKFPYTLVLDEPQKDDDIV